MSISLPERRLLIADSNKSRFQELIKTLEEYNIRVLQVTEKKDVLKAVVDFEPNLVLINLFLGQTSTLPVVREIKERLSDIKSQVIVLTAHYSKANIMESVKNGAIDFILEPFDPALVIQRIRYHLQDKESIQIEDLKTSQTAEVVEDFQLLYDCLRILADVKVTHTALHEVLKRVAGACGANRVNLVLGDLESSAATILASSDDPALENLPVDLEKYPEVREVLLRGSIVYVKDITSNPLTKDIKQNLKNIEFSSLIVMPIRNRQESIGTLNIRLQKANTEFSERHIKAFYMIALALSAKVAAKKLLKKLNK